MNKPAEERFDMLQWMDLHAHLNMLEEGAEEALRAAREVGVVKVATIGTEPEDLPLVLALAEKHYPDVFCTLGIHPHEGQVYTAEIGEFIEAHLSNHGSLPWVKSDLIIITSTRLTKNKKRPFAPNWRSPLATTCQCRSTLAMPMQIPLPL